MPAFIRISRGEMLALREEDYVPAAIANGAGDVTVIFRHILPNMSSTLLVQATVTIPAAIVGEAVLSFLGLGVQPPTASWGVMLQDAQSYLSQAPRLAVFPGSRSCSLHSRSTCSATGCATSSIRERRADGGSAAGGDGPLGPFRHGRRPCARRRPALLRARRGRGARDRGGVRVRQERDLHVDRAPAPGDGGGQRQRAVRRRRPARPVAACSCGGCADVRSRSSSRSR